jgi:hypothetical protein
MKCVNAVDRYAARQALSLARNGLLVRNERDFLLDDGQTGSNCCKQAFTLIDPVAGARPSSLSPIILAPLLVSPLTCDIRAILS